MKTPLSWRRKLTNLVMLSALGLASISAVVPLVSVFYYVLRRGLPALNIAFFTELPAPVGQSGGGMANALIGSTLLVSMASLIGVPLGVLCGVFLSEFGRGRLAFFLRYTMDILASVPSIVVGLFVYALLVVPMKGFSAHAGGVALAIIILPIMAKTTEEILKLVPTHIKEAGLALGIPRWRVIFSIVLKGSLNGLVTGGMLALARAAGETAPLLFTAFANQFWPQSLNHPMPSLPVQIYNYALSPYEEWHNLAWAGALVLVATVFGLNLLTRFLTRRRTSGERTR